MHENREISSLTDRKRISPAGEGNCRTSGMNGDEKSDRAIVPMKSPNKAKEQQAGAAEVVEERARAKENIGGGAHVPDTERIRRVTESDWRAERRKRLAAIYPKVRAVCVSSASTDLCGGCWVTGIPTATERCLPQSAQVVSLR